MTNFTDGLSTFSPRWANHALWLMLSLATGWSGTTAADTAEAKIDIKLTVLAPVCKVTAVDGGEMNVDFGDNIQINNVYDRKYARVLPINIDCGGADLTGKTLKIALMGTPAAFAPNKDVLQTSMPNLGILVYEDFNRFIINQPQTLAGTGQREISALPVKNPAGDLQPGPFTATATLMVNYE